MKRILSSTLVAILATASIDAADAIDQRVQDLLARMSVEEKAGQMVHYWRDKQTEPEVLPLAAGFRLPGMGGLSPAAYAETINRLQRQVIEKSPNRIPALIHDECLHGAIGYWGATTSFPQSIGLAASFDPELVRQVGTAIAEEERSVGARLVLAPVLNLSRDPRWGRTEETFGESPRLAADLGVAYVKPFRDRGIATALKHFVANYGDGGSDSAAVFIEASELHNVWFKPFRAAVQQGGAAAVMPCYNSVNGLPAHANPWLLTTVLRKGWGFDQGGSN
jgi:beta-glucosidase